MYRLKMIFGMVLGCALTVGATARAADDTQPHVEIAIAPFLPTAILIQNYQPMMTFLEQRLKRPVVLVTAPDYRTFNERMLRREYRFMIAVANSAFLAITDAGYTPLLRPAIYTRPVLVVQKASTAQRVQDMKNLKIATTDAMGVVAMQGTTMLRDAGIDPYRDIALQHLANHGVAVNFVLTGEVDAAIVSDRALKQMPENKRDALRVVHVWEQGAVPGVVYLASKDIAAEIISEVRDAILAFTRDTEAGRDLMVQFGYGSLLPVQSDELKFLAPYAEQLKALLSRSP